jgi:hypothetical protein
VQTFSSAPSSQVPLQLETSSTFLSFNFATHPTVSSDQLHVCTLCVSRSTQCVCHFARRTHRPENGADQKKKSRLTRWRHWHGRMLMCGGSQIWGGGADSRWVDEKHRGNHRRNVKSLGLIRTLYPKTRGCYTVTFRAYEKSLRSSSSSSLITGFLSPGTSSLEPVVHLLTQIWLTYLLTYLLTHSLRGARYYLKSW